MAGTLYLGTSGLVLPGPKATFPPAFQARSRLHYYASLLSSIEVNSTFYKIPRAATFESWAADVGPGFRITVKLWREITHAKDLAYDPADIAQFLDAAAHLGARRGCLLIQFPPSIPVRYRPRVQALLGQVSAADPDNAWPKAVEFRHASWYDADTMDMLDAFGCSLVLHDKPGSRVADPNAGAPFIYLRLHGPTGDYRGDYGEDFLQAQAEVVRDWLAEGRDVWVYFNNTAGAAFENARRLGDLVL